MASEATPAFSGASLVAPALSASDTLTMGAEWRSSSTTCKPFLSVARCVAGKATSGAAPSAGKILRSTPVLAAASLANGLTVMV